MIQEWFAKSRMEIEQARWLVLHAAWKIDKYGKKEARNEISMIKTVCANTFQTVVDRAIQVHGAMGTTNDIPLARLWAYARILRLLLAGLTLIFNARTNNDAVLSLKF